MTPSPQPPAPSPFPLSDREARFLRDRAWRNRFGRTVVPVALVVWLGFCAYLFLRVPLLANPWHVADQLAANTIDGRMLVTLAGVCPLAILTVGFVFAILLVFVWGWASMERRYLELLKRLGIDPGAGKTPGA